MGQSIRELEALIESGVPLVERAARQVCRKMGRMVEFEDVRQIGIVALVEAAHRFDPSRQVPFEIWAARRVRGGIVDGMSTLTGLSRAHVRSIVSYNRFEQASTATHERLNHTMKLFSLPDVQKCPSRMTSPIVRVVRGEKAEALIDLFGTSSVLQDPAKKSLDRERFQIALDAIKAMPTEERTILTGHYLEGKSLSAIAEDRGVSRSWLSRLHQRALQRAQELAKA